jgi:hypothetical protein
LKVNRDYQPGERTETLQEWTARQSGKEWGGDYSAVQIAEWLEDEGRSYAAGDLTLEELRDLVAALRNIRHLDRAGADADGFLTREGSAREAAREAVEAAAPLKDKGWNYAGAEPQKGEAGKMAAAFWMGLRKASSLLRYLDGMKDFGPWWRAVYRPVDEAANVKATLLRKASERVAAAFAKAGWDRALLARNFNNKEFVGEWGVSLSKMDLITIALNMGSESNLERLLSKAPKGFDQSEWWHKENWDGAKKIKAVLANYLTAGDFELAGRLWKAVDLYAEYDAMVLRATGFHLPMVEAVPTRFVAKGGKDVYVPGGYWPLREDRRGSVAAERRADEAIGEARGAFPYPGTGASKKRTKAKYSVDLDFSNIYGALERTAQDIAFRPAMLDVNKFMRQEGVAEAARAKLGDAGLSALNQWLDAVATGRQSARARGLMAPVFHFLRERTVVSSLLFRVGTVLQNFSNFLLFGEAAEGFGYRDAFLSLLRYGVGDYSSCALGADIRRAGGIRAFVREKSPMMRGKREAPDFTLAEMRGAAMRGNYLSRNFRGAAQYLGIRIELTQRGLVELGGEALGFADSLIDIPIWLGAYEKALKTGKGDADAAVFADTVVERATGTGRLVDTSAFRRGSPGERLLSMFTGFFNTAFNRWADEYNIQMAEFDAARLFRFMFFQYLGFGLLSAVFSLKWPGEDEDRAERFVKEIALWPLGMAPVFGAATSLAAQGALGFKTYGFNLSPAEGHIRNVIRASALLSREGAGGAEKWEAGSAPAAFVLKYPDQFNDWFWNAHDVLSGSMEFEFGDLARRRPKRERR